METTSKVQRFVDRARGMIREITDPVELKRQLEEMIAEEFPLTPKPVFDPGETLKMHEFLARYQKEICRGVVPRFYETTVRVLDDQKKGELLIRIKDPQIGGWSDQ